MDYSENKFYDLLIFSIVKINIEPGHVTYQPNFLIKIFKIIYNSLKKYSP